MFRTIALTGFAALVAATTISLAPPARAQIGNIFSDPPPRPPGNVPRGQPSNSNPTTTRKCRNCRAAACCRRPIVRRRGRACRRRARAVAAAGAAARHHRHSAEYAPGHRGGAAAAGPGRRQRAAAGQSAAGIAAGTAPAQGRAAIAGHLQPGDEVVTEPPAQKIVNKKASFSGLDKITGRIINFDEDIGETVQFGALRVKTDACYTRPATEAANTDAFVEVDEITLQGEVKRIFSGWMFAASPGLHGVEHPDLRYLADRLQRPRPDHRQRAARSAEAAAAAARAETRAAEAGRAASAAAAAAAIPAAAAGPQPPQQQPSNCSVRRSAAP
jgi:hypothetical protein